MAIVKAMGIPRATRFPVERRWEPRCDWGWCLSVDWLHCLGHHPLSGQRGAAWVRFPLHLVFPSLLLKPNPALTVTRSRSQRGAFRDVCARGLLSWTSCNFTSQNVTPATPGIGVRGLPACEEPPSWQGSNKRVLGSSRAGKWHPRAGGVGECCHGDPFMPH